jgi:Tol biopolymer transport system component
MKLSAAIVVSIGLLAAAGSSARSAESSPRELVFARGESSRSELYVMREDGSRLRRLTRNAVGDYGPSWSPDGKRILFASNRDGDDELYVMDANGRNVRQLTRNRGRSDLTAQWSPNGRWIAFASDRARPGEHEIFVMRANGTRVRRLVPTTNHPDWQDAQFSPVWSPDGRRIVFSMYATDANPELYVVGADGRGHERLTFTRGDNETYGDDTMPDWSRDGRTVIFVSNREGRSSDVWVMNANGSRQRPIVRRPNADDWHPRYSPDGRKIAFTQLTPNGGSHVWVMNRDGSGAKRLGPGVEPHWRTK